MDSNSAGWFSYVIVFGELAVGVGLILGAFVGLAAAGGLLILAWKNAGCIGLDYFLLPMLGTPWKQSAKAPAVRTPISTPAPATH